MPATEIVFLPLAAGSKPGDPENDAAAVLKSCGTTILSQPGAQQIHFGTWIENENHFQMLIDWDSVQHHNDFIASSGYAPFRKSFTSFASADAQLSHVDFQPHAALAQVLAAPVTEIATFYFDGAPPADYLSKAAEFIRNADKEGLAGARGMAVGTTYEEVEYEGVKGIAAVFIAGWTEVEAHVKVRDTQFFKDNIALLRQTAVKMEMHHTQFMQFLRD